MRLKRERTKTRLSRAIIKGNSVFIEGNDNFEMTLMQACDRPLKHELMKG